MATIDAPLGETFLVKIEMTANSGTFTHPALINTTRALSITVNTEDAELVDVDDQSLPAQVTRRARSFDTTIDGAGMISANAISDYIDWAQSGQPKNVKYTQTNSGATGGFTMTGPYILTDFRVDAERAKYAECTLVLKQAGKVERTDNA